MRKIFIICLIFTSSYAWGACTLNDPDDGCPCGTENSNGPDDPSVWCADCGQYADCERYSCPESDGWKICAGEKASSLRRCRVAESCAGITNCDAYDICDRITGTVTEGCPSAYPKRIEGVCYKQLSGCEGKCYVSLNNNGLCTDTKYVIEFDTNSNPTCRLLDSPTNCVITVRQGPLADGTCKICPVGEYYKPSIKDCATATPYAKKDMLYGKGKSKPANFGDACWPKRDIEQYASCVKNQ